MSHRSGRESRPHRYGITWRRSGEARADWQRQRVRDSSFVDCYTRRAQVDQLRGLAPLHSDIDYCHFEHDQQTVEIALDA